MAQAVQLNVPEPARQIAERLRWALNAEAVFLFGSHARGSNGPGSDLDIAVIVPDSRESRYRRNVKARGLVSDFHVAKDIVVLTHAEWDAEKSVAGSLANTVAREGIKLHG